MFIKHELHVPVASADEVTEPDDRCDPLTWPISTTSSSSSELKAAVLRVAGFRAADVTFTGRGRKFKGGEGVRLIA